MTKHPELGPLKPGDRVGLVAPSGPTTPEQLEAAQQLLQSWSLIPVAGPHVLAKHPRASYLAGTDQERASDLQAAWTDDSLAAVFCIRGGYGAIRLLDLLDVGALKAAKPKALIGSSDITGLHEFWADNVGVATWFAPMIATNAVLEDADSTRILHDTLFDDYSGLELSDPEAQALVPGIAKGTLTGGNLSLLVMALGAQTPTAGASVRGRNAGKIVLLEDVTEDIYRLDGLLMSLLRSGYFEGVAGIALGTWEECGELSQVKELVQELLEPLGIPLVWGLRFGHGPNVATLPLGVLATLTADQNPRLVIE